MNIPKATLPRDYARNEAGRQAYALDLLEYIAKTLEALAKR